MRFETHGTDRLSKLRAGTIHNSYDACHVDEAPAQLSVSVFERLKTRVYALSYRYIVGYLSHKVLKLSSDHPNIRLKQSIWPNVLDKLSVS